MNTAVNILALICAAYAALLFFVAFMAERAAKRGRGRWLQSPIVYTLSLSIYCTAWTFYGAVGFAARSGLEYLTIYIGPSLVMIGWWWVLRKLVRVGRAQRITSIADLISNRFGKSNTLAVMITLMAVQGPRHILHFNCSRSRCRFLRLQRLGQAMRAPPWETARPQHFGSPLG